MRPNQPIHMLLFSYKINRTQKKNELTKRRTEFRRKEIVERLLLPGCLSGPSSEQEVWVDGTFLRRVFSCQDGLEDLFRQVKETNAPLQLRSFNNCANLDCIEPRVAWNGKVLPVRAYQELENILCNEYKMYHQDKEEPHSNVIMETTNEVFDIKTCLVLPSAFQRCKKSYQSKIRHKLGVLKTIASIYDDLREGNEPHKDCLDKETVYAITRTWATAFKAYVKKKLIELAPSKNSNKTLLMADGGIDFLDLSKINQGGETLSNQNTKENKLDGKLAFDPEDATPTSRITCE